LGEESVTENYFFFFEEGYIFNIFALTFIIRISDYMKAADISNKAIARLCNIFVSKFFLYDTYSTLTINFSFLLFVHSCFYTDIYLPIYNDIWYLGKNDFEA